jgi:NAD(P)H dehydrogenase (quinone)
MIVVTGATGQLGQLVIAGLLEKMPASNIVAAVRDVGKAAPLAALGVQVRAADYDRPASLDAAFQGAEKILLISSNALGRRVLQHGNVIAAAVRAGAGLLAYTSVLRADTSVLALAQEHLATEVAIRASGLPFTLLRNGWYLENHTAHLEPVLAHGAVLGSAGEGRFAAAGRADYAAAAVAVLCARGRQAEVLELAGGQPFTRAELAAEVARQSGKAIVYNDMPPLQYKQVLVGTGMPEPLAELLADSDAGAAQGALDGDGGVLEQLIGRPTLRLADAVRMGLLG